MRILLVITALISLTAHADYKTRPFCHGTDKVTGVYSDGALRCGSDLQGDGGVGPAGPSGDAGFDLTNEGGAVLGHATTLNCVGNAVECSFSSGVATLTANQVPDGGTLINEIASVPDTMRTTSIRRFYCSTIGGGAAMNCVGGTAGGSGSATSPLIANRIAYMNRGSTAAINGGCSNDLSSNLPWQDIDFSARIFTSTAADLAQQRHWYGVSSGNMTTTVPSTTAVAETKRIAMISSDPAVASGNWLCCGADATSLQCSDMGTAPAADTAYLMRVVLTASGVACSINNGTVTTETNFIPQTTATQNAAPRVETTTKTATLRRCYVSWFETLVPG